MNAYTSYEVAKAAPKARRRLEDRLSKARRFDAMCRQLGFTRLQAAKTLQVSERTLHNWVSGTTAVPYAAYKLLRVLCFHEIPFKGWHGWHFSGGKLWSPEGHGFIGTDSAWWSLLVRQARSSSVLFEQQRELRATIARLQAALAGAAAGHSEAAPDQLSLRSRSGAASGGPGAPALGSESLEVLVTLQKVLNFEQKGTCRASFKVPPVFSVDRLDPLPEMGIEAPAASRLGRFLPAGDRP